MADRPRFGGRLGIADCFGNLIDMSPAASAKTVKTPTASPGVVKGKMTLKNASIGRAPRSRAASINRLSINSAEIQMASTMPPACTPQSRYTLVWKRRDALVYA